MLPANVRLNQWGHMLHQVTPTNRAPVSSRFFLGVSLVVSKKKLCLLNTSLPSIAVLRQFKDGLHLATQGQPIKRATRSRCLPMETGLDKREGLRPSF